MDKAKTLEVLRGMKFMQRKEEKKRRELFELDQEKQLEEQLKAASNACGEEAAVTTMSLGQSHLTRSRRNTATILYDTGFPRESYTLARRSFVHKASPSENVSAAGAINSGGEHDRKVKHAKKETREDKMSAGDNDSVNSADDDKDSDGGDYYHVADDPTAVSGSNSGNRFCVNSRAPVLPKGLVKQMNAESRKKRRRQEEERDGM